MDSDEIEALKSLYYLPDECLIQGNEVTLNILVDVPDGCSSNNGQGNEVEILNKLPVKLVLVLTNAYPQEMPEISVFCEHLDRDSVTKIKLAALENCKGLIGEPLIIALVSFIQDYLVHECRVLFVKLKDIGEKHYPDLRFKTGQETQNNSEYLIWTTVLHIDHMRSKTKYCKTIEKWAADLSLTGRLLFYKRLILVVLQGDQESIKNFMVRLKTMSVDVDSKGHSCKERMMTVVCEEKHHNNEICRFTHFQKCELTDDREFEKVFTDAGLGSMHSSNIANLK